MRARQSTLAPWTRSFSSTGSCKLSRVLLVPATHQPALVLTSTCSIRTLRMGCIGSTPTEGVPAMLSKCTATSPTVWPRPVYLPCPLRPSDSLGLDNQSGSVISMVDSRYKCCLCASCCPGFTCTIYLSQLNYDITKTQLEFIRVGSRHATQTFTYRCKHSSASVIFRTQNNKEITPTKVLYDGCQVGDILSCTVDGLQQ